MSEYYDRQGKPLTLFQWAALVEDVEYKRVAYDELVGPEGLIRISTIWLGLDYSFDYRSEHIPIIFETMIFGWDFNELECWRYPTEEAALAGHDQIVAYVKDHTRSEH